jgi:hypothetical protein
VTTFRCGTPGHLKAAVTLATVLLLGPAAAFADGAAPEVVARHAPLIWLHSEERLWPMSAGTFVNRSALLWSRRPNCADTRVAEVGDVRAGRLGSRAGAHGGPYTQHPTSPRPSSGPDPCRPGSSVKASNDYTRPETHRVEGFYLDLANSERVGAKLRCPPAPVKCEVYSEAPVYYQYSPRRFITYWFFFGFSSPFRGSSLFDVAGHEGDWERISVRLDSSGRPTEVAYYQHKGDPTTANRKSVSWSELGATGGLQGERPIVFVARGSHASYPKACRRVFGVKFCATDLRDAGWRWTASEHLRDVTAQPWYGFGGAWGALGGLLTDFSGPAGPGPNGLDCHKPAAPRAWLPEGVCG